MKLIIARMIGVTLVLLLAGFVLASCGGQIYQVVGNDMEPAFQAGQVITAIPVPTETITRGEPVVYQLDNGDIHFKRVVGVPGDIVSVVDEIVFINGARLDGPQLSEGNIAPDVSVTALDVDEYFMLGYNLADSYDSRHHGPIPADHILGRVEETLFSRLVRY